MERGRQCFTSARTAALAVAVLLVLPAGLPSSSSAAEPPGRALTFERGRRDLPELALTFDGGSDAGESSQILDVLEQNGVIATFFLTGRYIRQYPDLVRRIAATGHEVGNHTWSHPHLTTWNSTRRHRTLAGVDRAFLQAELERTARSYEEVTGRRMAPIWRAPFGEVNDELLDWADATGWSHVGWTRDDAGGRRTLDSLDWVAERTSRNYLSSEQIAERILSFEKGGAGLNGGVVLMHMSSRRVDPGVTRLGDLIGALRNNGYNLVTVMELRNGFVPSPAITATLER